MEEFSMEVRNICNLPEERLPGARVALGDPDDYKPCIARLPSGELVIVAFQSLAVEANRVREPEILFRSADDGKSWSTGSVLEGLLGREPYLTVLDDGTLLMTVHFLGIDTLNPDGYTYSLVHRSIDGGYTWSTTRPQPPSLAGMPYWLTRNILQLADGSLLLGIGGEGAANSFIWHSHDGGITWSAHRTRVAGWLKEYSHSFYNEGVLWQARSGKIYLIARITRAYARAFVPEDRHGGRDDDYATRMILCSSNDLGRTFETIGPLGALGDMYPSILRLHDGRLLLTFTVRSLDLPIGVRAVAGREHDDGFEFDREQDVVMLDPKTPADRASGGGFGPTVQLADGTLVTSYSYRGRDDRTHLEVVRWRLP